VRRRALIVFGAAAAASAVTAGRSAWAHAILIESVPRPGGTVAAGRTALHLRFNSRIDHARSQLRLVASDGATRLLVIANGSAPDVIDADVELRPGAYTLRWQVLAVDGHLTRGEVAFSVTA